MSNLTDRLNAALEGRYQIEGNLGEGGMATVYLAEDLRHERKVALKVLRPELAAVVGGERFLAEIKTTANLQHPHILPLFDSGEADSFLFYVMPYVEGESLRDRLQRDRQLPVDEAVELASKVASALQYAHENDIVHRDIKPANILLSRGEPLVADFGIALALTEAGGGRITETGLSLGTPHYMSPEQAAGERSLDVRSDVYALGSVLYEMLTGEPPYGGPNAQAVLARILTEVPRRVTEIRRTVPANVEAAVARALEKLPADRFASADGFRKALHDTAFRHATTAPEGPAATARLAPGRAAGSATAPSRGLLLAVSAFALVATVAAVLGWARGTATTPPQSPLRMTLDPGELEWNFGNFDISPDGTRFAIEAEDGGIWVRTASDPSFRFVAGTEEGHWPSFSPDGQWLAFSRDGDALMKVAVEGGSPLTLAEESDLRVFVPHWGADGHIVWFGSSSDLYRVADTGGPVDTFPGVGFFPHLLPDGSGVLAVAGGASIVYLDLATDSVRTLIDEGVHPVYVEQTGHILYGHPGGGLFAAPFDPATGELTGSVTPVSDDVAVLGPNAAFAVSRNGTLFYGTGGGSSGQEDLERLLVVGLDGTTETLPLPPRDFDRVRYSPDGGLITFTSDGQIYTYEIDLGTTTQLTFERSNHWAVWSPDGTRLAYTSVEDGEEDLWVKAVDGTTPAERLVSMEGDHHVEDWPADDLLVTSSSGSGNSDLFLVDPSGQADPTPYLQAEWSESRLDVSPDGALAAYMSDEGDDPEIYVRRFPEPRGQWRISDGRGFFPRWSTDGGTIYYWTFASGPQGDTLWAARLRTSPSVAVLAREVAVVGQFDTGDWDLHPDGRRFVVPQNEEEDEDDADDTERRLWVVANWFSELEERMGVGGRDR